MHTDGVGTKVQVAIQMDRFETIGIDCVAMTVNDLICVGASPSRSSTTSRWRGRTRRSSPS